MDYRQRLRRRHDPDSTKWDGVGDEHHHLTEEDKLEEERPRWDGVGEGDEPGEDIERARQAVLKEKKRGILR